MTLVSMLALLTTLHSAPADTTLRLGAKVPTGTALALATVAASPEKFTKGPVVVEGVITAVCQEQGCWMEISHDTTKGALPAHVDFEHKFMIPMNSSGMKAKIVGTVSVKKYTKEQAEHYIKEGAQLKQLADGTASGIEFIATGVELRGKLGAPVAKKDSEHDMKEMKDMKAMKGGGGK